MSGLNLRSRARVVAMAAAAVLVVAGCQPPQLPESAIRLPEFLMVRTAGRVESIALEEYVLGSAIAEVSPVDQPQAAVERIFEVQAVLARTYAAGHIGKHRSEAFDLCDTTHCQLYDPNRLRVSRFAAEARNAVRRTEGLVLVYQGRLAEGLYHADCGGHTAAAEDVWGGAVPYLIAAPDDVPSNAHRQWRVAVPLDQLRTALNANPRSEVGRTLYRIDVLDSDCGGHANHVAVAGEHTHELRGEEFRTIVNHALGPRVIQSTLFTVTRSGTDVVFAGAGFGHGVGLCQVGAAERARRGESLEAIVDHYFPGVIVARR
jgi:stage II sporulation protein D